MTRYSYSRVDCFKQCPRKYKYRYLDKLKALPDLRADNALFLGSGLHKGIETTVEEGVLEYQNNFYVLTDQIINWSIQLEYWIPKVKDALPEGGQHEVGLFTPDFVGYIDYVCGDTLFDFKFSNNVDNYLKSDQLSLYKYYYELTRSGEQINHLVYVFIPKSTIRQKDGESIDEFRARLIEQMDSLEIQLIEVPYDNESITRFWDERNRIETATDYPTKYNNFCGRFCEYNTICQKGENWNLELPKNEKRELKRQKLTDLPDMFIYGASYVGKSTVFDSLSNVLFINTDGNYDMYRNPYVFIGKTVTMNGRMKIEKSAWENFLEVIDELEKKENTFKYVCLDLVEDLREHCRVYVCNKLKIPHESDSAYSKAWDMVNTEYNQAIKRIKAAGYTLLEISKEVAKEISEKSGAKYTTFNPNLPEKAANILAGMVKLTARVYVDDKGERWFNLEPNPHWFGGGRYNFKTDRCKLTVPDLLKAINDAEEK